MLSPQSEFPLRIAEEDGRTTVRFPTGTALSGANAEKFSQELSALAEGKPNPHLFVDLDGVPMLTSMILAKLIALNGKVRDSGGRLTLANPTSVVRQVLRVTRLDAVFDVTEPLPA